MRSQQALRSGEWEWDPLILDDQAMLLHVRDKGFVVLTGCGHAGIVNTVRYAQKLTGIEQVYVIIGGFHLGGMTPEPLIQQTCDALASGRFIAWQPCSLTPSSRAASGHASSCRCHLIH